MILRRAEARFRSNASADSLLEQLSPQIEFGHTDNPLQDLRDQLAAVAAHWTRKA